MPGLIGRGVTLSGFAPEPFVVTWNVTGTVTQANVGELVQQDTTVANSVKLLADGGVPIGALSSYEDRSQSEGTKVGAVAHRGGFTIGFTGTLNIGDSVVGSATPGLVKQAPAENRFRVVEKPTASTCVVVAF